MTCVERFARAGEDWASTKRRCTESCTSSSISDAASAMNASQKVNHEKICGGLRVEYANRMMCWKCGKEILKANIARYVRA